MSNTEFDMRYLCKHLEQALFNGQPHVDSCIISCEKYFQGRLQINIHIGKWYSNLKTAWNLGKVWGYGLEVHQPREGYKYFPYLNMLHDWYLLPMECGAGAEKKEKQGSLTLACWRMIPRSWNVRRER